MKWLNARVCNARLDLYDIFSVVLRRAFVAVWRSIAAVTELVVEAIVEEVDDQVVYTEWKFDVYGLQNVKRFGHFGKSIMLVVCFAINIALVYSQYFKYSFLYKKKNDLRQRIPEKRNLPRSTIPTTTTCPNNWQ